MKTLTVALPQQSYPIYIGADLLGRADLLHRHIHGKQVFVVSNTTVAALYLPKLLAALGDYTCASLALPDGEKYKRLEVLDGIFDQMLADKFNRDATIIALGGGVVGDMAGFAAAIYQRGINLIQIPTTLLAQVDSSVGGKTGVNHRLGKNMLGAFYQPQCVIADIGVLATMPPRQLLAGIAEVIKYGLIMDYQFLQWLEENIDLLLAQDNKALIYAVEQSARNKAQIVAQDETESGIRAILNLGHTFGHAIETATNYDTYLHGEAVAIGICYACDLSRRLGYITANDCLRVMKLLHRAKLPTKPPPITPDQFIELMAVDKKNKDGEINFITLERLGKATLPQTVNHDILRKTLTEYGK